MRAIITAMLAMFITSTAHAGYRVAYSDPDMPGQTCAQFDGEFAIQEPNFQTRADIVHLNSEMIIGVITYITPEGRTKAVILASDMPTCNAAKERAEYFQAMARMANARRGLK